MEQILEKQQSEKKKNAHHEETPLEFIASICSVLVLGLFALTFIFQNFEIPSASMEKTLLIGDHVLVDRMTLAPPAKCLLGALPECQTRRHHRLLQACSGAQWGPHFPRKTR